MKMQGAFCEVEHDFVSIQCLKGKFLPQVT
jgi:hypothetical protein